MKKTIRLCLMVLLGSFMSCSQRPMEIFVSNAGDDSASGNKKNPVRSIERAANLTKKFAGKHTVHVLVDDGIYYLQQTISFSHENSGSAKHPVVFQAMNEGKAIISGGKKLTLEWTPYKDGIYKALIADNINIDQLYVNGQRQRMARFPNAVEGKNVFDTWDLIHTHEPDPDTDPLTAERISTWKDPEGAFVHAMHTSLWGDMHWLIKGKNSDGTLDLEGGWQNNRPSPMHPRYRMVENVFEELDIPGEWFYHKKQKNLYYYPTEAIDLDAATIEVVKHKHLFEFNGEKEQPVSNIRIAGFVFRHTARSFMENKEPLLRSDWTTYRGGAILFNGAEDCSVVNCEFDQLGGNSIFVNNYNRRVTIKGCYVHHSGANGIAFVGNPNMVRSPLFRYGKQDFDNIDLTPGPKGKNFPEDCLVEDCLITMTGRYEKQTSPVQISMSHNITIRHCSVFDVPRAGINISEGTFGGHLIEYCDVFNTVLETGDHGSFNSWGRDRFWTPNINETAKEVEKIPGLPKLDMLDSNTIRFSRWRCDHGWDIDLDDGSSWYRIYNNVLLNGGLKLREGYDRIVTNNIIINNSLHPHVWYPESGDVFKNNIVFAAYKPAIMTRGIENDGKWGAKLDSNLFVTNPENKQKFYKNGCDLNSIVGNPEFIDPEEGDFRVRGNSPALKMGFKNFPMNEFGVVSAKLKAIAKKPDLPDLKYDIDKKNGVSFQWLGATVKNVETSGEQSAAGLPSMSGVILLEVPQYTYLAKLGFKTGDVIVQCENTDITNFLQLTQILKKNQNKDSLEFKVWNNQLPNEIIYTFENNL